MRARLPAQGFKQRERVSRSLPGGGAVQGSPLRPHPLAQGPLAQGPVPRVNDNDDNVARVPALHCSSRTRVFSEMSGGSRTLSAPQRGLALRGGVGLAHGHPSRKWQRSHSNPGLSGSSCGATRLLNSGLPRRRLGLAPRPRQSLREGSCFLVKARAPCLGAGCAQNAAGRHPSGAVSLTGPMRRLRPGLSRAPHTEVSPLPSESPHLCCRQCRSWDVTPAPQLREHAVHLVHSPHQ